MDELLVKRVLNVGAGCQIYSGQKLSAALCCLGQVSLFTAPWACNEMYHVAHWHHKSPLQRQTHCYCMYFACL